MCIYAQLTLGFVGIDVVLLVIMLIGVLRLCLGVGNSFTVVSEASSGNRCGLARPAVR